MKTDAVDAHVVEEGELVYMFGEILAVKEKNDNEKVALTLCDEDGVCQTFYFEPFDEVILYFGEDDVEIEDVPIED